MMVLLTRYGNNQPVSLTKLIADSGEGQVWQTNLAGYLAKIYHDPTPARIAKLTVMLANPPADPMLSHNHVSIAWVSDLLKDSNGKYVGFLMPEIKDSKPLSSICNPKLRKRNAPGFNWYYLHVTALNTAWIIQEIHAKGYVLGDIKLENILVNNRAMTAVIDTDSFQVRDTPAKKVYRCTVGSEGFTPPELLGKDFHKVNQSQNQDRFRLGVLIHFLLFGYHPFSGSWTGVGECPEQTELIRQGYWYGGNNSPIRESATTIPLEVVHLELKKLFLRCFNDGHEQSHLRPTAKNWHEALETAVNSFTACNRIDSHYYSKHYGRCYWCDRAANLGIDIFPGVERFDSTVETDFNNIDDSFFDTEVISSPQAQPKYSQKTSINNNQPQTKTLKKKPGHSSQVSKAESSVNFKQKLQCIILLIAIVIMPVFILVNIWRISSSQTKASALAQNYIEQGLDYFYADEYQKAIDKFTHAIQLDSNNNGYFNRGNVYYYLKEYRKAIDDYTQSIRLNPNEEAHHNRGKAYYYLGKYQEAIEDYTQALLIKPDYSMIYNNRGLAYDKLGNRQKAIRDFEKAASLGNEAAQKNLSNY